MSDPVTNVEIEDVLSSIRRLIADGDRRDTVQDRTPSDAAGPLVLGPALRVGNDDAAPSGATAAARTDDPLAVARMVARIEAAVTVDGDDFEPDGSESAPLPAAGDEGPVFRARSHVAPAAASAAPPADDPEPEDDFTLDAADADDDVSAADLFGSDGLPEEQVLRDLITEILRDELAGGLGERITRNVRKLVRREIHRALASRETE
ncbi:MAG: hypothetical protein H3C51_11390 [Rubellimicrobium sp.]|nr:hypothetical protein [Rubellimicrobium sp.]